VERAKAIRSESHGTADRLNRVETNVVTLLARKAIEEAERAHSTTAADLKVSKD
jgi:hypothetical protein